MTRLISLALGILLSTSTLACSATTVEMIPPERIAREPVPSAFDQVAQNPESLSIECHLLREKARQMRVVQLAGIGLTTLGLIGALLADDEDVDAVASVVATTGSAVQLLAGTAAQVREAEARERNCGV